MDANVGDRIIVESSKVGQVRRSGEVVDVIKGSGGVHYRIRWEDGHETILYPSSDAHLEHAGSSS